MSSSTTAEPVPLPVTSDNEKSRPEPRRLPLLDKFLADQQDLSAVERFSQYHDESTGPLQAPQYKRLLPATPPSPGQQYAFEVDLDACTGCKACVTACHNLNGLEESETWRSVGMLHGGTAEAPVQKTVTTACHHCIDPGCMSGCPVQAYEKDAVTGIVKHLDDQCIGCQYCIFTCPYEVPQFSKQKGIVRKCDMCSDRLAEGEAPACVQACPNEAIAIRLVDVKEVLADAQTDAFLPGTPSPGITGPSTTYKSEKAFPRNMRPADFFAVRPAHQHMPLVIMLVLTQLSAGAFTMLPLLSQWFAGPELSGLQFALGAAAALLTTLAMGAASLHVGRPLYGFRALLGLRTSWMSREILMFGVYSGLSMALALLLTARVVPAVGELVPAPLMALTEPLALATAVVGLLSVYTSVMLYAVTKRLWWTAARTAFRFYGTAAVLGLSTTACAAYGYAYFAADALPASFVAFGPVVAWLLAAVALFKLAGNATVLTHLRDKQHGDLKRSAILLTGELRNLTLARVVLLFVGGVAIPLATLSGLRPELNTIPFYASALGLMLLIAGELVERMLFFAALSSPRMPGGLR